ncbi:alpha-ketoglutarate decarboxylase [Mariniflexile gromovii]|uniref:Alpha-ketoglutarate decarboxylase n=1 Tax=Mariniflexile gromovii TaxID=362523 RepID=A0ABS4BVU5_9FLAO|nr:alpha-ketoglutarate decarboxylase [Mariniflexile gromovii]MBP0904687.1 alpha-ketoglutarate decarboxylase [Mariniflexile gromovii]
MNRFYLIIKIYALFFFIILSSVGTLNAQESNNNFWNSVRFGGGIGLSFGDGFFSGTLAPSAIYEFNNQVALGFGLNGTYNKQKDFYKSTILGGSLIGLFSPINEIQLSAEFEELHVNRKYDSYLNLENDTYWSPALFIGAGYRNGNVTIGIRYDLLYDKNKSIYADAWAPFVRFYF